MYSLPVNKTQDREVRRKRKKDNNFLCALTWKLSLVFIGVTGHHTTCRMV